MKTLKAKRNRKIAILGAILLAFVAVICIATDVNIGGKATLAMATVVGGVTLEGKDEAAYLALKESIDSTVEKHTKGYITETKMMELINAKLSEFSKTIKDVEEIKKMGEKLEDTFKTLSELGLTVKAMTETSEKTEKSIREQLEEHRKANPQAWENMKKAGAPWMSIELKTAGTMMNSTNTNSSVYTGRLGIEPGFVDIARRQMTILPYLNYATTDRSSIVWIEKTNKDGQATFIAEGVVKPLIDFEWKSNRSDAKKVAAKTKVSTEMIDDIDFMDAEIRNELKYECDITTENAILSGEGGDSLTGITEVAAGFVLTSLKTKTPNNYDACKAAATQIRTLYFTPNLAFLNPIDFANMELTKDSDGGYILPPFSTADGKQVSGLRIIESPAITEGYILCGDMMKAKVREYKTFVVSIGWVNDDFEKNLVTMIGERRLHLFIADNDAGAFVYDTLENIKTAITQL